MITLYDCSTAPSPRRARIVLAEKGIPHDTVQVNLAQREQMGDAFRAINPRCTVPALRLEDGTVLTDNAAIEAWAEAAVPEPPLFGRSPVDKAEIASWHWRVEFEGLQAIAEGFRNGSPAMAGRALSGPSDFEQIPALAQRGVQRTQLFLRTLDDHLRDREFIAAGQFSIADVVAVVTVDFARILKVKPGPEHPHLLRWREAMGRRPSMSL
jgi:glutathione S-transferase